VLQRGGYAPERVADGIEAMQRIATSMPDLLLLDLRLPRLNGVDLLKKLRQSPKGKSLPVVIVTGAYKGERFAKAAEALGVRHYLEKPFTAGTLLHAVRDMLPSVSGEPLSVHLYKAFRERFSGVCRFGGGTKAVLSFLHGVPVSLQPGFVHRDFGDFLQKRGVISAEEATYYRSRGEGRGDTLVQLGCLRYAELLQETIAYLTSELVEAFTLPPLPAQFQPAEIPAGMQVLTLNVPYLFYLGYHRSNDPALEAKFLADKGAQFVAPSEVFYRHINFLSLNEEERLLVKELDGSKTLAQCLEGRSEVIPFLRLLQTFDMLRFNAAAMAVAPPSDMPLRTLFNVVEEEIVPVADEPLESFTDLVDEEANEGEALIDVPAVPPQAPQEPSGLASSVRKTFEGMQGKNYYQIFGMEQGRFSFDRLKEAYFKLTREFGPETMMQLSGEEANMVEEILSTVTTAYNTLSDVVKKERYDELLGSEKVGLGQKGDDIFQAQVQFQSGKVFLDMGEWDNAEKAIQDACNIVPQNGDYLAHLAWSIYRNPRNANSRAMLDKARQMVNRALTLDRVPSAYAFKGWMLFEAGQDALAESEFNKALKLDARNGMARKGLRELMEKREQEKKGLFKRMFK